MNGAGDIRSANKNRKKASTMFSFLHNTQIVALLKITSNQLDAVLADMTRQGLMCRQKVGETLRMELRLLFFQIFCFA